MKKYAIYKFVYVVIKVYFPFSYFELIIVSAISTELSAAPLNKLSETIHKLSEFFLVLSSLILDM